MNEEKKLKHVNFQVELSDSERLKTESKRLSLPLSEIARRALRLGLTKIEKSNLPGGEAQ